MTVNSVAARGPVLRAGDLLPDGEQFQPDTVQLAGGRLSFDSEVANTGQAPLELALRTTSNGTPTSPRQVIFNRDGSLRQEPIRGSFSLDDRGDHNHLHFNDFVYFQLFKAAPGAGAHARGRELASGIKQSFFITDVVRASGVSQANRAAANLLRGRGMVDSRGLGPGVITQGISVGWADVYGSYLEGQSLAVGNLAPGRYVLRQTFDPNDELVELDEKNNSRNVLLEVTNNHTVRVVSSQLVEAKYYKTQADGRTVVPSIVSSMERAANRNP